MALYLIGDVQGCDAAFLRLLQHIDFSPSRDTLYMLGDMVNRGPQNAQVLRRLMGFGSSAQCVLGNHDLHLLAVSFGARKLNASDTIQDILDANTNQLIVFSNQLANSVTANTDNVDNITYSSNLTPTQLTDIQNYCLSTKDVLYTIRTLDWDFFRNSIQVMKDNAFLQQFSNMGGTQSYLVKNIIGTPSLVEKLTANTINT